MLTLSPLKGMGRAALIGVAFTVSFSLLCGPPVRYVWRRLRDAPPWKLRAAVLATGFCGGSLALTIVAITLGLTIGHVSWGPLPFGSLAIIDGALAAAIAVAISAHERTKAERDAADTRLKSAALTAQIRPHFLFNTLNAISAQVQRDPIAAQENLGRLAEMFRYTMNQGREESVSLAEEIALAREYLLLEQTRFGARLQFELPVPMDLRLPPLTLQPLVENAVRHGISKLDKGGCVEVRLEHRSNGCYLRVRNPTANVETPPPSRLFRAGHALGLLRERHPDLIVRADVPGWFEVELKLR